MKRSIEWLKSLTLAKKVFITLGAVVLLGIAGSNNTSNLSSTGVKDTSTAKTQTSTSNKKASPAPTITTKTETETQPVPFTSTTTQDSSLAKGTTKISTAGVNGSETLTYQSTYEGSKQTGKKLLSTAVTVQPIVQVTSIGTYVAPAAPTCPNGTYVNSAGNTVCSPYASPSAPAGATAQCVDGTYSSSQSHSGTCSHHGGVAQWL